MVGARRVAGSIIGSDLEMTDVIVVSNVASQGGGGIYLQIGDHSTSLTSNRCVITHNRAPQGAGIYDTVESHLDLVDSTVANNDAELDGGGLFSEYATTPNITRTTISDNSAGQNGGGKL